MKWKKELIIKENILTKEELSHINIVTTSKLPTLGNIESEILTKRNTKDFENIINYSVLLKINTVENHNNDLYIEISKKTIKRNY